MHNICGGAKLTDVKRLCRWLSVCTVPYHKVISKRSYPKNPKTYFLGVFECGEMMSILALLEEEAVWNEYLDYKTSRGLLCRREENMLRDYIGNRQYVDAVKRIKEKEYDLGYPIKHMISKVSSSTKRIVYTYPTDETMVLKLISYLLYKYDGAFAPNCYSFRKNTGAKKAMESLIQQQEADNFYCYKVDIKNYFNSIDVDKLLMQLRAVLIDDAPLYGLFEKMLTNKTVLYNESLVDEDKGVMAGTPTSPFLANLYLSEVDRFFYERNILYARYSDDIIIFGSREQVLEFRKTIKGFLEEYSLRINESKEETIEPGKAWAFLGFQYCCGKVDLSEITKKKIKAKIKRKARALYRWKIKKGASDERALKAMNRCFNRKFYSDSSGHELSWARWFFPTINTDTALKEIDAYMQQTQRYIVTGRYNKANYEKVPYAMLKTCGYMPLVSKYYGVLEGRAD